jgi:hypothetical protein
MTSNRLPLLAAVAFVAMLSGGAGALLGTCGPFTDVAADGFCSFVLEIFTLGITTGTSATTYDPASSVSRLQMAAFLSLSVDGVLRRGSPRAALRRFWSPTTQSALQKVTVGLDPTYVHSDGSNVWVSSIGFGGSVSQVRAADGKLLGTWTGSEEAQGVLVAMGRVFVAGATGPGKLYRIDPTQPPGAVTTVASNLGNGAAGIAYDGAHVWTANISGSVSIATPGASIPRTVTTVATGFVSLSGMIFDGTNIWVTDVGNVPFIGEKPVGALLKLDAGGAILQTITVGKVPRGPTFDGTNIWVPNSNSASISVVRASSGAVLRTLTGNGLVAPWTAASDGQRVLIADFGDTVSLWKAADLTPLGSVSTGSPTSPYGACSDGVNFWVSLLNSSPGQIARF